MFFSVPQIYGHLLRVVLPRGLEIACGYGCGDGGEGSCAGVSAVQSHSKGGVRGGEEGHTHTQERTRECCTYPLATYPLFTQIFQDRLSKGSEKAPCSGRQSGNSVLKRDS